MGFKGVKSEILTEEMRARARELRFKEGCGFTEITEIIAEEFFAGEVDRDRLYSGLRGHCRMIENQRNRKPRKKEVQKSLVAELLRKPHHMEELRKKAKLRVMETKEIIGQLQEEGHHIKEMNGVFQISKEIYTGEPREIQKEWNGEKILRIGLVSDTHMNSIYTQITALHELYEIFRREGITEVYHAGDLDEGEEMRVGHKYECYRQGVDEHIEEIVRVYPKVNGIRTKAITGNHDHSLIKRAGFSIGPAIASRREDFEFLGMDYAKIMLTPNFSMELRHPADGSAYSLSYKPQKMVESMGQNVPNLLVIGHYHKAGYFMYRGVHAILAGTTQAQSSFMRNKSLEAHVGGWIIEIHLDDEGREKEIVPRFFPLKSIQDDWKNWR